MAPKLRLAALPFATVYPLYVRKAEKKGRTKQEVDAVITWLTGYSVAQVKKLCAAEVDLETFFAKAKLHRNAKAVTGVVCGVRVEDIEDPLLWKIRVLDKLIDELARGKALERVLRVTPSKSASA